MIDITVIAGCNAYLFKFGYFNVHVLFSMAAVVTVLAIITHIGRHFTD